MGVSEKKKNQSESGWLALGIHLGLSKSSLFPESVCSGGIGTSPRSKYHRQLQLPHPLPSACRGTMSSYLQPKT